MRHFMPSRNLQPEAREKIMLRGKSQRYSLELRDDIPYCYCVNELTLTTQGASVRKALDPGLAVTGMSPPCVVLLPSDIGKSAALLKSPAMEHKVPSNQSVAPDASAGSSGPGDDLVAPDLSETHPSTERVLTVRKPSGVLATGSLTHVLN